MVKNPCCQYDNKDIILLEGGNDLRRRIILAVSLVLIGFGLGLSGPRLIARAFRHGLEAALRRQLAGAKELRVEIDPVRPRDLLRGTFYGLKLTGREFTTFDGLRYRRLDFMSKKLSVDPVQLLFNREIVWRTFDQTRLQIVMDESSIETWLRHKHPEWEPDLEFVGGKLLVNGRYDFSLGKIPFTTLGRLEKDGPDNLRFIPERIRLGGISFPKKWLGKKLESSIGGLKIPLKTPFPLALHSFKIREDYLMAEWREMR